MPLDQAFTERLRNLFLSCYSFISPRLKNLDHSLLGAENRNQDEKLLSFEALEQIKQKEQERLHRYTETYFKDTYGGNLIGIVAACT